MKQILLILAFLLTTFLAARVGGARECPVHTCSVLLFEPICARDIIKKKPRSFGNDCEFDRINCKAKLPVYEFVSKGICMKKL